MDGENHPEVLYARAIGATHAIRREAGAFAAEAGRLPGPPRSELCSERPGHAVATHERFADRYPEINPFEQAEVIFTAGPERANANTKQPQPGWQFKSDDEQWTITLQTSSTSP